MVVGMNWKQLIFLDDTVSLNPLVGEVERSYITALAMSRSTGGKEQRIIILGDADCLSNGDVRRLPQRITLNIRLFLLVI